MGEGVLEAAVKAFMKKLLFLPIVVTLLNTVPVMGEESKASSIKQVFQLDDFSEETMRDAFDPTNQPEEKPKTLSQKAGVITGEMAKFYMVVAGMEFTKCMYENNATLCDRFIESLKDPAGHVGFALFMMANKRVVDFARMKGINPVFGNYLGLSAGMMANTVFIDLYNNELIKNYFKTFSISDDKQREIKRKEAFNAMYNGFKNGSLTYLFNKIPDVASLLGSAYLSGLTTKVLGKTLDLAGHNLVRFGFDQGTLKPVLKYGRKLRKQVQIARTGFKYAYQGGKLVRLNPVVKIGAYVVETSLFLAYNHLLQDIALKHWDRRNVIMELQKSARSFEELLTDGGDSKELKKRARKLFDNFDDWRNAVLYHAHKKRAEHVNAFAAADKKYNDIYNFYDWMVNDQANYGLKRWTQNQDGFRPLSNGSRQSDIIARLSLDKMANKFFCTGVSVKKAFSRKVARWGIPSPFRKNFVMKPDPKGNTEYTHYDRVKDHKSKYELVSYEISPIKVMSLPGICESDIRLPNGKKLGYFDTGRYKKVRCPIDFDFRNRRIIKRPRVMSRTFCNIRLNKARISIFRTRKYGDEDIYSELDKNFNKKMNELEEPHGLLRNILAVKYEKQLRKVVLEGLTGREVEIKSDDTISYEGEDDWQWEVPTAYWGVFGNLKLGYIPSLHMEKNFWMNYVFLARDKASKDIVYEMMDRVAIKLKDAKKLEKYTEQKVLERERKYYPKLSDLSEEELAARRLKQLLIPNGDLEGTELQQYFSAEE